MIGRKVRGQTVRHNKRYDKNEHAIWRAILKLFASHRRRITARQVAKAAGVSRQTIYNHHPNINRAIIENEEALLEEFSAELNVQLEKSAGMVNNANRRIFNTLFIFMAWRKEIFSPIFADLNNQAVLYQMMEKLYPNLQITWLPAGSPAPAADSERGRMFTRMAVEVICRWGATTGCDLKKTRHYINRLLRITEDAGRNRLG